MNIDIVETKDNPLLERQEVRFRISHEDGATPKREEVREQLAGQLNTRKMHVVIASMNSKFGVGVTDGVARVYTSPEAAAQNERLYLVKRNNLEEYRGKKKEEAA